VGVSYRLQAGSYNLPSEPKLASGYWTHSE
jgi:hypothetical protein